MTCLSYMSSTLTGIKTAECLSEEKANYFVYSVIRVLQLTSPTGTKKMTHKCGDCFIFASFSRLSHDVMSEFTFSSLTRSLNDIKLLSWYRDVDQDGLLILYCNKTSELMLPSLTDTKIVTKALLEKQAKMACLSYIRSNATSELKSSSLTGTKTAECLSVELGQIFGSFSNKNVVAHQLYWHQQMTCKCGDCFIFAFFSRLSHVNCKLFVLYSVRVGTRLAVPK